MTETLHTLYAEMNEQLDSYLLIVCYFIFDLFVRFLLYHFFCIIPFYVVCIVNWIKPNIFHEFDLCIFHLKICADFHHLKSHSFVFAFILLFYFIRSQILWICFDFHLFHITTLTIVCTFWMVWTIWCFHFYWIINRNFKSIFNFKIKVKTKQNKCPFF